MRHLGIALIISLVLFAGHGKSEPIDIGSRLELMVDDHLIESMTGGAAFALHHPVLMPHEVDAQPVMP